MRSLRLSHLARAFPPVLALALASAGCGPGGRGPKGMGGGVPVSTAPAAVETVTESLSLVGTLGPDEQVEVRPERAGIVAEIAFEEGMPVRRGSTLIRLDSAELEAQLKEADANLELAAANNERVARLYQTQASSGQEYDRARLTKLAAEAVRNRIWSQLEKTRVLAPFDGIAGARRVSVGQFVNEASVLTTVVDADPLKAEFRVPERFAAILKKDAEVELRVNAYPDRAFAGRVYFVSPSVDVDSRTVLVKATVPNAEGELKPGMFANLQLVLARRERSVVIPEEAIAIVGGKPAVFVVRDGRAALAAVETGMRMKGRVEILSGIEPGATLVTAGIQRVRDGTPVFDPRLAPPAGPPGGSK